MSLACKHNDRFHGHLRSHATSSSSLLISAQSSRFGTSRRTSGAVGGASRNTTPLDEAAPPGNPQTQETKQRVRKERPKLDLDFTDTDETDLNRHGVVLGAMDTIRAPHPSI